MRRMAVIILFIVIINGLFTEILNVPINQNQKNDAEILVNELYKEDVSDDLVFDYPLYSTNTGSKYHRFGCKYLNKSCIHISSQQINLKKLEPCSVCKP